MVDWKIVRNRIRRAGDEIAPIRNICWFVASILAIIFMIWSFIGNWFFPVFAFVVVGGQFLWASASVVQALRHTRKSESSASPASLANNPNAWKFFVGRWRAGIGNDKPQMFAMVLREDYAAQRYYEAEKEKKGTWEYVDGQAIIRWEDDWVDVLRCTPGGVMKIAYHRNFSSPEANNTALAVKQC